MYSQTSILRHHIYKAVEFGADFRELCDRLNVTPEILADGEALLPFTPGEENDFWTHAVKLTGNPCLGLHMGSKPDKYNSFGMLGLLAGSSQTVGDAFQIVSRFNDTLTAVFSYKLTIRGNEAIFEMNPHALWEEANLESARQAVDMSISSWLNKINEVGVRKIYPVVTKLKYTKRFEEEYRKITNGPVLFNQPSNCFVFRKEDLQTPLLTFDQTLTNAFEALIQEKQRKLTHKKTVTAQVRNLLLANFQGQPAHIDIVASTLFMTTRTLQRKLAEENTTYRIICNNLRKELAQRLLKVGSKNKSQVASILGYADLSTFNKALKSWNA